jgi:hypothetical protein
MIKIGFIFIKKFYKKRFHSNTRFLITKYCLILYQQLKNLIKVKNVTSAINSNILDHLFFKCKKLQAYGESILSGRVFELLN